MAGKFTVSEFVVEMGFKSDSVMRGLEQLEKRVMQASLRIEKRLNNAFRGDFTLQARNSINKLETASRNASDKISRNLQGSMNHRIDGSGMFRDIITQSERAARLANRNLRNIRGGRVLPNGSGGTGGSGNPRLSSAQTLYNRFSNSAALRRLEVAGGRSTIFMRDIQSRAAAASQRYSGDVTQLRRALALLDQEVRDHSRTVRLDSAALRRHEEAQRRERLRGGSGSPPAPREGSHGVASGTFKGLLAGNAAMFALSKSIEGAKESFELGKERQQSRTMLATAVGEQAAPDMQKQLNAYADRYGNDYTETTKQFSKLRAVFGHDKMSNSQLLQMMEGESVFAHSSGISNDEVSRANTQLAQLSGGSRVMKSDLNALGQSIPEWARVVATGLTGKNKGRDSDWVKRNYADISPDEFMKAWQAGLKTLNEQSGAAIKAQTSVQAAQGRMQNQISNALISGFEASGNSAEEWLDKIGSGFKAATPLFVSLGHAAGFLSDKMSDTYGRVQDMDKAFSQLMDSFSPQNQESVRKTGHLLGETMSALANAPFDKLNEFIDKLTFLARMWSGDAKAPEVQKKLTEDSTYEGSRLESWVNDLKGWWSNGNSPMLENMKNNLHPGDTYNLNTPAISDAMKFSSQLNLTSNVRMTSDPIQIAPIPPITLSIDSASVLQLVAQPMRNTFEDMSESQLVSAQGLGGGWQAAGQNAGFSPSLLKK